MNASKSPDLNIVQIHIDECTGLPPLADINMLLYLYLHHWISNTDDKMRVQRVSVINCLIYNTKSFSNL